MDKYRNFKKGLLTLFDFGILQVIFPDLKILNKKVLEERLKFLEIFPKNSPTILKILDLFENTSLDEKISICKYLKLSNKEIGLVTYYSKFQEMEFQETEFQEKNISDCKWAHLYANKNSSLIIDVLAMHKILEKREEFLKKHQDRKKMLFPFIERIIKKDPLVKSIDLKNENIKEGPLMGKLLKEAEKNSIEEKIEDKETIISKLKKSSLWKEQ
jgi:tRNA nucleotidyltransferase/poly(A) polymerase